jgi:hypothetical protein
MTTNLVGPTDFPASRKSTYLNTAAVALMYRGAEVATTKWFSELAEIVREGQERGEVRATLDPKAVAQILISLLEGFVLQKALDPSVDSTNYLEALDAFLNCSFWQGS